MIQHQQAAKLYLRRNGSFGSSCDGCQDTGHFIAEDAGLFTVYRDGEDVPLVASVPRAAAEIAIAKDWRAP